MILNIGSISDGSLGTGRQIKKASTDECYTRRSTPRMNHSMKTWEKCRANPLARTYLLRRGLILTAIRSFFRQEGFLEVDTPLLVRSPGMEPYLEVFETTLLDDHGSASRAFLLTSPEYAMKKLLVGGFEKIFTICKSFRNGEGRSRKHNPEFSILEWYRTQSDYHTIMDDCERLFTHLATACSPDRSAHGAEKSDTSESKKIRWTYQGREYDLSTPWERVSVAEAFLRYCEIDSETLLDEQKLKKRAQDRGFQVESGTTWEQVYNQFFLNDIEPHLGVNRPTIIFDFPASQAALAKRKSDDPRFAERFEFYVAGIEMGNAFSELTDAHEQRRRFSAERAERAALNKTLYDLDEDYLAALEAGLPPTGGIAVGIDRIVMFFADAPSIQDVLISPVSDLFS